MRIYVLVDNSAGRSVAAEHGLSYLVENNGVRVLFDTGQTGLFLRNAKEMGVDPGSADYTVLSHGHYDHGGGLGHLGGGILVCHPGCFEQRYSGTDKRSIGLTEGREWYENKFTLITSRSPYQLGANIFFSGEIPRLTAF